MLVTVLGLSLDSLPRLDLPIAVALKSLVNLVMVLRPLVAQSSLHSLMLVLESLLRLLITVLPFESSSHHLLLKISDLLLNFKLCVVIDCTLICSAITLIVL